MPHDYNGFDDFGYEIGDLGLNEDQQNDLDAKLAAQTHPEPLPALSPRLEQLLHDWGIDALYGRDEWSPEFWQAAQRPGVEFYGVNGCGPWPLQEVEGFRAAADDFSTVVEMLPQLQDLTREELLAFITHYGYWIQNLNPFVIVKAGEKPRISRVDMTLELVAPSGEAVNHANS